MKSHSPTHSSSVSSQPITNGAGLAVLSTTHESTGPVAVLAMELDAAGTDGWYQLLPAGTFRAVDGRPHDVPGNQWHLDDITAQGLIQQAQAALNDLVIDYEHQTLNAGQNGQPAPAAGWFRDLEWRDGSGLWIRPRWTPRAKEFIKNGEYRYLSAVFPYDAASGKPLRLHSAALTNRAGVDGLNPLASLRASDLNQDTKDNAMNELLIKLLTQLGLTVDPAAAALTAEQETEALAALKALADKAGTADTLATQVAALSAKDGSPDPRQYVPIAVVTDLQAQLAVLSAQHKTGELEQLITSAKNDGRLLPSMEAWARDLGGRDMAALSEFLDKAAPIVALTARQAGTPPDTTKDPLAALSAQELKVCRESGISPEDYLKTKQAQ